MLGRLHIVDHCRKELGTIEEQLHIAGGCWSICDSRIVAPDIVSLNEALRHL